MSFEGLVGFVGTLLSRYLHLPFLWYFAGKTNTKRSTAEYEKPCEAGIATGEPFPGHGYVWGGGLLLRL